MNGNGSVWRYFGTREVRLARRWAEAGGVAVHENIFRSRGRRTAHLLAVSESSLVEAALTVGCHPIWIQRTRTVHFDLVGPHLERALVLCGLEPGAPARRFANGTAGGEGETGPDRPSQ